MSHAIASLESARTRVPLPQLDARRPPAPARLFMNLVLLSITSMPIEASTVAVMDLPTIADHSAQVILGTVSASRSYYAGNPRTIETEIVLTDVAYWKGKRRDAETRFTLRIPGGKVGTTQMRICCAPLPTPGEKWLFFLLPTYKTFPTVGLYQGAYRIIADQAGVERVYRGSSTPVTGILNGLVQARHPHDTQSPQPITADRARVVPIESISNQAMTLAAFRSHVEPILQASRRHNLSAPAGRRVPANLMPTTLKQSRRMATPNKGWSSDNTRDTGGRNRRAVE